MANAATLYEALDVVIAKDAEGLHQQAVWVTASGSHDQHLFDNCGTAGCLAGWKAMMDGYTEPILTDAGVGNPGKKYVYAMRNPVTGERLKTVDIREYAMNAFGLDEEDADVLFYEENTLEDLKEYVDQLALGKHIS